MKQLDHAASPFLEKRFPIVIIADGIKSPANAGSLLRLADAFNIEGVVFCGPEIDLSSNRLKRTARSTINSVKIIQRNDIFETCREYLLNDYMIFALEITKESVPLQTIDYSKFDKIALVIGNENVGIAEEVLNLIGHPIHINMFGKNSSMNVSHAAGIALFEITKSLNAI